MSIQSEIDRLKTAKSGLATAITGKGVTVPEDATLSEYPALVDQIQTGGGGSEPEPPDAPDDGKTRLYIHVPENAMPGLPPPRADVPLYISQTVSHGVTIDWGDDSEPETISGTGKVNTTHHYNAGGDYVIALTVAEGCELGLGWGSEYVCILQQFNDGIGNTAYCNMLQKAIIGSNVADIDSYAFTSCPSLSSVVIPDGVTSIGVGAFRSCFSLSSVVIPDGVTSIGEFAFTSCPSLSSVVIPDGVTSIGAGTFYSCSSLSSVVIPDGVTSIGVGAFYSCFSLSSVVIPDGVTSIGAGAFDSCSSLSSVVIPDGVTSIGQSAFTSCSSLSSVVIPDGVTSIGQSAFYSCSSLSSVVIPDGVTSIDQSTFDSCSSLSSVVIPDGVTSIGEFAFYSCGSIKEYHFLTTTPPSVQPDTFYGIPSDCIIYVPAGTVDAYKAATNWAALANHIQEEPA